MLRSKLAALSLTLGFMPKVSGDTGSVRDFLAMPLPATRDRSPIALALELAYPDVKVDEGSGKLILYGQEFDLGDCGATSVQSRLVDPSIADMFAQIYPLDFDLDARLLPWFDPGRVRHDGLLRALYGRNEQEVAAELVRVTYAGPTVQARFAMSIKQGAARQLQAALDAIAREGKLMDDFFRDVGGSFNWRLVAGTNRPSAHSFGIAVDFNTKLGGYWRWSGAQEGNAGSYDNKYPEPMVRHMERFGFIWGGKWHHFDGMHFEYRPELILYARLAKSP